jgi:hypothetical protein
LRRGLRGPGGGGIAAVVVGMSGEVGPVVLVVPVGVELVPDDPPVEPVLAVPEEDEEEAGSALPLPPEETITPTIAPVAATTATAAISKAFRTGPEATLARDGEPCRRAAETASGQARRLPVPR